MVISLRTYLILLAAVVVERIHELTIARGNARRAFAEGAIEVGHAHYRAIVVMHTLFIASCACEAIFFPHHVAPMVSWLALGAALAAQALRYWARSSLGERWNTRIIVLPGAPPITRGPYRFMRHPNYLAVIIEMAAVPMVGGAIVTAAVFTIANAIVLAIRIPAEERAMGALYAGAFSDERRFIPRIRHDRADA
ncbi:MAG TPA: isoprenylcysteine carboxylmethyltransferase family protein [Candidatus Binataceae bacterium]|jgi:methyltransferase